MTNIFDTRVFHNFIRTLTVNCNVMIQHVCENIGFIIGIRSISIYLAHEKKVDRDRLIIPYKVLNCLFSRARCNN